MKLQRLFPDARSADLLAATLLDGDPAREAWSRFTRTSLPLKRLLGEDAIVARPLLPLVYESVRRNQLSVDDEVATYLRSAFLTESIRSRTYRAIVSDLTSRLNAAGIAFLLVKGAAIGPLYYADPALRHVHDVELLIDDPAALREMLASSRFHVVADGFVHDSGLPLRVHARLFVPASSFDERVLWQTSIAMADGTRTLASSQALALTLIHASRSIARQSCRWLCDAQAILRRGSLDWSQFTSTVCDVGAALPAHAQLLWMRETFAMAVPDAVLAALAERAMQTTAAERAVIARGLEAGHMPRWRRFVWQLIGR